MTEHNTRIRQYVVFGLQLSLWGILCFSQSYQVQQYLEADGLPSATVYDLCQDQSGRMWFGTRSGIALYDGKTWINYTVADGLTGLPFGGIRIDHRGRVWALAESSVGSICLSYFDPQWDTRWHNIKETPRLLLPYRGITSFQILKIIPDQPPAIAVGTASQGLFIYYLGKWKTITEKDGLLSNWVNGIACLDGKFYLATERGLSIITLDKNGHTTIDNTLNQLLGLPPGPIKGITVEYNDKYPDFQLPRSRVWLYNPQWLGYFLVGQTKLTTYRVKTPLLEIEKEFLVQSDYRTGLYVGSQFELAYFNYKTLAWQTLDATNGLVGAGANGLFIDFEKNIWVSCDRGVSKIVSRRFSNFRVKNGLLDDEVTAILEYEPGKFVLGHNKGLTFYDGNEFQQLLLFTKEKPANPMCRILEMKLDSQKNIWLAMSYGGLVKVDARRKSTWYGEADGLPKQVSSLWFDNRDTVWVGTNEGIYYRAKNRFSAVKTGPFAPIFIRKIFGFAGQLRYIASMNVGVFVNQNNQWKNYRFWGNTQGNAVYAIQKDSRGRVLVGTLTGLFIIEQEKLQKFKAGNFEVNRPIYVILEDRQKRLWFGTDNGVIRWDGKEERKYSINEGLSGQEINRSALLQDSLGRIWIGTTHGVSIYDDNFDNSRLSNPPPKLQLLGMEVAGQKIPFLPRQAIRLSYKQNTIVFNFRGISFIAEKAIRFKSKLEGFDAKWSEENYPYNQMIRYANLPAGNYRFYLKARNAFGVWSDAVYSPMITILRPFYQSWWFYLLLFLVGCSVVYTLFRFFSERQHAAWLEKQVEERTHQLKNLEQRYRNLFEESKDAVFISTPEGTFLDANPASLEIFGFSSRDTFLNIKSVSLYSNPQDRLKFQEAIEAQGYVKDYELEFIRKDGEVIIGLLTATLVRDETGKSIEYRGILRDITGQKKLEQQLIQAQKMEAIGTLAGGIAHDFNNILGVIIGYTELSMEDLPEGSPTRHNNEQVLVAAERATELVKQILAFSRQTEKKRKPLHVTPIITEALKLLRSTLPTTIEIFRHLQAENDIIMADATQIHQVMMNLCTNAAHAMKENGGVLTVGLNEVYLDQESIKDHVGGHKDINPGPFICLTVSDTGHGIPEIVLKRIFEPYFTTKKTGEGTGMGLAVIHGIVKSHGGDIAVQSEPGKGASFRVYLPQIKEQVEPKEHINEVVLGGKERLLLVDDESELSRVESAMLRRLGYDVVEKFNALEALELLQTNPDQFDLVISDITMPRLTGIQLAEQVKRIHPHFPIILASGFSAPSLSEQINNLGVDGFIMKPIIKNELARLVRHVLDKRKGRPLPQ